MAKDTKINLIQESSVQKERTVYLNADLLFLGHLKSSN